MSKNDRIYEEQNGLWYERSEDYYIPYLTPTENDEEPIGIWGIRRKRFLQEHRRSLYSRMSLDGTLWEHLREVDKQAHDFISRYVRYAAKLQGTDEELKASDQMACVGVMKNIRVQAEEIIMQQVFM